MDKNIGSGSVAVSHVELGRRNMLPLVGVLAGGAALAPASGAFAASAKDSENDLRELRKIRDTAEITQLIIRERTARDLRKWDEFKDAYFEDSKVEVSWFTGTGWEFVDVTKKAFANTDIGVHLLNA